MQIRGAPLIGIAGAYGFALSAASAGHDIEAAAAELRSTRPTAVNLCWALDRCLRAIAGLGAADAVRERLAAEAIAIHEEDIAANHRIGAHGAQLLGQADTVLTHCNAGALATGGYGTALGVIRSAYVDGRIQRVLIDETRPLLQGSRLTAWELERDGIPCSVIVDSAAGSFMRRGEIDAVITGADRITANGDVANKIGTYQLAVLARENNIPFYVAAPTSTIDLSLSSGDDIPIEQRSPEEVTHAGSQSVATPGVEAENPAFDVTPNQYVTAIITENGVARPPYTDSLRAVCASEVSVRG